MKCVEKLKDNINNIYRILATYRKLLIKCSNNKNRK